MKLGLIGFFSGLLFAVGLAISGMTNANKVIGFLDLSGDWDPSLAFVMLGGVVVHGALYYIITRRSSPLFAPKFLIPTRRDITPSLVAGSALFGAGWGLGGFCPGPGLVSAAGLGTSALAFAGAMLLGMFAQRRLVPMLQRRTQKEVYEC